MRWTDETTPGVRAVFPAIVIECVTPTVDAGRHAAKRIVGDELRVGADIFKDGHDLLAAHVLVCGPGDGPPSP